MTVKPTLEQLECRLALSNAVPNNTDFLVALEAQTQAGLDQLDTRAAQLGLTSDGNYISPVEVVIPFFGRLDDGYAKTGLQNAAAGLEYRDVQLQELEAYQSAILAQVRADPQATIGQERQAEVDLLRTRVQLRVIEQDRALVSPIATGPTDGTLDRYRGLITTLEQNYAQSRQRLAAAVDAMVTDRQQGADEATQWRSDLVARAWLIRCQQEVRDLWIIRSQTRSALGP
jgi:hypothetical protein